MSEEQEILDILKTRGAYLTDGHFKLVSGNHSDEYVHVRLALAYSQHASTIGKMLADKFQGDKINAVVGFTVGGTTLAKNVAEHLKARPVLAERKEGKITFAPGYVIEKGDNVLLVDDVLTTGQLIDQMLGAIRNKTQGTPKGVGVVVDRSKREPNFRVKTVRLVRISMKLWPPKSCPKCKQGIPLTDLSQPDTNIFGVLYSLPEEVRPVIGSTYRDILTKLQEGKLLDEILTFYKPIRDLPGRKWQRVAVLGSFDNFESMDNVAEYVSSLGYYAITSKLVYEKNTRERKGFTFENYESMNDFLRKMIFSCQYVIIIYPAPGSGGQLIETAWCSESNKHTLGLVPFPPWVCYDPKACDYLGYCSSQGVFFCKGFSAYKSGARLLGGWVCNKRKSCPFPSTNLTKMVLDLYATSETMFLIGGEPKNFKEPIHAFLKNKGTLDPTAIK